MSATANPHFELQQQALRSLRYIHQICLVLQCSHVLGSLLVLSLGYWARPLHLYAALIYFFTVIFAHVVVFYVLRTISKNVRDAHQTNPSSAQSWLVFGTARLPRRVLPFFVTHVLFLVGYLIAALATGLSSAQPQFHRIGAFAIAAAGLACVIRVAFALRENTGYLTTFVTAGATPAPGYDIVEH